MLTRASCADVIDSMSEMTTTEVSSTVLLANPAVISPGPMWTNVPIPCSAMSSSESEKSTGSTS